MYMLTLNLVLFLVCNNQLKDWSSFPSEELCPIRMIIEKDDADKFDKFLRKSKLVFHRNDEMLKYADFEMCPYGILGKICHHRAYKCATLLLSRRRKVGSGMKLNIVNCYGSYSGACLDARSLDAAWISPLVGLDIT
ncbi:hypothetical protein POM88_042551 [Heracleum sosnowskyi]|uniref:Uncharacterized protein n=1 Tax=Heracleum sosnowskyi TaxID=360622 RepID=A0AAD8M9A8_9APIA|nr:hypothetical protein POM88_042551 [Heracleum sosnowskyi]